MTRNNNAGDACSRPPEVQLASNCKPDDAAFGRYDLKLLRISNTDAQTFLPRPDSANRMFPSVLLPQFHSVEG